MHGLAARKRFEAQGLQLQREGNLNTMGDIDFEWRRKSGTLSDKTAEEEYGLTKEEILLAIRAGKLQRREVARHGAPWVRLLRREVEALVAAKHGNGYLIQCREKAELKHLDRELKQLKTQIAKLEERKSKLIARHGIR